jgi:adenylate cyclase
VGPEYGAAYAYLGVTHRVEWTRHWKGHQSLEQAFQRVQKAIALDDSSASAHSLLGSVYLWKRQHEKAIAEVVERAIALDPNGAWGYAMLGEILNFSGRPEEAIRLVEKAMRLDPYYPLRYLHYLGHAYRLLGRYEEAIATFKKILNRNPNWLPAHISLAAIYSELGREEEARAEAAEVLRISPNFSLEGRRQRIPRKDQAVVERTLDALRKAGLK